MIKVLNNNNNIRFFDRKLLSYYGISVFQQNKIKSLFGLSLSGFISNIDKNFLIEMEGFIREFFLIEDSLKALIILNIKHLMNLKLYKGFRHKYNLPVNGQRTRTNSKTIRRLPKIQLNKYTNDVSKIFI